MLIMNGRIPDDDMSATDQICCLVDTNERCSRTAGNAAYNKRIQRTVAQRKLKLNIDGSASHNYICEYHKGMIQSVRQKRRRRDSEDDSGEFEEAHEIDFSILQVHSLKRYKKAYHLTSSSNSKQSLVEVVSKHFHAIQVSERNCLHKFISMVKDSNRRSDELRDLLDGSGDSNSLHSLS